MVLSKANILKTLGPGILFASTAIGVSHLVQSTQAGANYGFGLLWAVLLANVLKYPFFEFGSRYANATGSSLIDGYKKLGQWVLIMYALATLFSMFFVTAAVGKVTAGFMQNLLGISAPLSVCSLLFLVCVSILIFGQYKTLDKLIKIIGATLLLSTLLAFSLTLIKGIQGNSDPFINIFPDDSGVLFLIGLMGWMPTAVDLSTWNSLWTVARIEETKYKPTLKETLIDFNFGYWISAFLSVCFVTMGAFLWYGTSTSPESSADKFAHQVITLYTAVIGNWSYLIIALASFSIMFGTCIAVFDGYGRACNRTVSLITNNPEKAIGYRLLILIVALGAFCIILYYNNDPTGFKKLVNFATTLSFLIAPIVAIFNTILVGKKHLCDKAPGLGLRLLSYIGIVYLTGFSLYYLYLSF